MVGIAALWGAPGGFSQEAAESRGGFEETFKLIAERNIFDPRRGGRRAPPRADERRPARVESFALVGTMIYEKGRIAFFDGSDSDFRKAVRPGDTIAGFTVEEVTPDDVALARDGSTLRLRLREEARREDEGEWRLTGASSASFAQRSRGRGPSSSSTRDSFAARRSPSRSEDRGSDRGGGGGSSSGSSSTTNAASPGDDADENEILKRLMQQREKELK